MVHIYLRVSTDKQDNNNQLSSLLERFPTATVHEEKKSGTLDYAARPVLKGLLHSLKPEDTLVVSSLDRLARKVKEAIKIMEFLQARNVNLISVKEGVDYSTPVGRGVVHILASVAEMERDMISERTRRALAAKRKMGIVGGRPRTLPTSIRKRIVELRKDGLTYEQIAEKVGVAQSHCWRICNPR